MNIQNYSKGNENARKYGIHEVSIEAVTFTTNPFDVECTVIFKSQASGKEVKVNAFYDGGNMWRARLYVDEVGEWEWTAQSSLEINSSKTGTFTAIGSKLKGMIKKHPEDSKQWVTDDGRWFQHISDTAYMLFNKRETMWKQYIEEMSELGITSVRSGSLGGTRWSAEHYEGTTESRLDLQDNWPWEYGDMSRFNLEKFKTTDERLIWMLNNYPDMYIQFILFGLKRWNKDDTGEGWKLIPKPIREMTMKYMIARWSAFPQLFWLVVNDIHCSDAFPNNQEFAREVGRYFYLNDPWQHLISVGPNRYAKFPFTTPEDLKWVSYIHLESSRAFEAAEIEEYRHLPLHVFLGEDVYEHTRIDIPTKIIKNPAYYYRWLFWSWTLSGGSANYGGRYARLHPYSLTASLEYYEPFGNTKYDYALEGLDNIRYLKEFFDNRKLSLCGFIPGQELILDLDEREKNGYIKLLRRGFNEILVYHPNALFIGQNATCDESSTVRVRINLKGFIGKYEVEWYSPSTGTSARNGGVDGDGYVVFKAPWKGQDTVLYLKKKE